MVYVGPEMEIVEFDSKVWTDGITSSDSSLGQDNNDDNIMDDGSVLGN